MSPVLVEPPRGFWRPAGPTEQRHRLQTAPTEAEGWETETTPGGGKGEASRLEEGEPALPLHHRATFD